MNSPEFKIIFGLIIFAVSFGIPLIQLIHKRYKHYAEKQRTPVPNDDSDDIFWEDEVVDNGEEDYAEDYVEDETVYYELKEARDDQRARVAAEYNLGDPDELENIQLESSTPTPAPVTFSSEPAEKHHYDGYAVFLHNNLRSSIVAAEILGKPKGLQD